jgi:hypothetical protein
MLATTVGGGLLTSTDYGQTWSILNTGGTFTLNTCTAIVWNGKIWVAGGNGPNPILTSPDGITWTPAISGVTLIPSDIKWNGSLWVAVGRTGPVNIITSVDGKFWSNATSVPANFFMWGLGYSNGRWVAVGSKLPIAGIIMYSDNGKTWTESGPNFLYSAYGVVSNGTRWVAVGQEIGAGGGSNTIFYSDDNALTWISATGPRFATTGTSVDFHGGRFVAVGQDFPPNTDTILTSLDGKTWSLTTGSKFTRYADTILWNGKRWVSTGSNNGGSPAPVLISDNGTVWTTSTGAGVPYNASGESFGLGSNNVWDNVPLTINDAISSLASTLNNMSGKLI